MVDTKITDLTEDTAPLGTDLLVTVDDPGGSPVNKKATIANVIAAVISAWAKAATKPTYSNTEVGAAATSHSHVESDVTSLTTDLSGKVGTGDARLSDARTPVAHNQLKASITDFPASLPASDVSAWAKAASKPSYTYTEVGAPSTSDSRLSDARTPVAHIHVKANITDFPASMPASDVSAWAKAGTKPSYTYTEVGAPSTSDSRLSNARPASDVSAWAKAASKPSYTAAEVGARKSTVGSLNTGSSDPVVVTHGLGSTPTLILIDSYSGGPPTHNTTSINSTTFTVRTNNGATDIVWIAFA